MNIMLQIAGFFVMIVIFIFYFNDRKAAVKSNRLFLYQGIAIFVSIFLDISSIVLINTPGLTESPLTYIICRAYLVSCIFVVCLGLFYVLGDAYFRKKTVFTFKIVSAALLLIGTVLTMVLPLEIVYDPNGLNDYTQGAPIFVTYIDTFIFMIITLVIATLKRKFMYKKRFVGVYVFISLWVFGSGVQALFNYLLTDLNIVVLSVSFAESLGALVIYIMLENPALNLDKVTGTLTQRALQEFLSDCYDKEQNVELIVIDYDADIASSIKGYDAFSKAITKELQRMNVAKIFRNDNNKFVVVRNPNNLGEITDSINLFKDEFYKINKITTEIPYTVAHYKDLGLFYNPDDLLDSINYVLTKYKNIGTKTILVDENIAEEIHKKFLINEKCDLAFTKKNIEVFYQPILSTKTNKFVSAEALVRLKADDGRLIYPGDFITEMERDGRIVLLGKIVFSKVCEFISQNNLEELGLDYIEVNLSAVQATQEDLAKTYIEIMEKYNVNPKYINLEITETAQSARKTMLNNINALKEYGVTFSLDDFGTGNSNLNYIVEMPVKIVKFDKEMVTSYFEDRIASYVMDSTIEMIKGLGHKIVFEGIEEKYQVNKAKEMNVEFIQGYYYSKPIDKKAFLKFIKENNVNFCFN